MSSSIPLRRCTKCGQEFPATTEYFYPDKRVKSGLRADCRVCQNACSRAYRRRPEIREILREYHRKYQPTYRRKSEMRQRANELKREYRLNPEFRAREAEYRQAYSQTEHGKAKHQEWQHRRRARIQNAPGSYTVEDIHIQLKMQTDKKGVARCWWCNKPLGDDQTIDHRIPLSRGGSNDARNIVIVHGSCNYSKNDRLPHEWNGRLL